MFTKQLLIKTAGLLLLLSTAPALAASGPSGFSYEGRLYDSSGNPSARTVSFILSVYNPLATCLLHTEQTASIDLSQTDGYFSVTVGQGTVLANDPGLGMQAIFANLGSIAGSGCTYTPVAGDGRLLRVSVSDGTSITAMTPDVAIGSTPYAVVADSVQGKSASSLLQVNTANQLNQANLESLFQSPSQLAYLVSLSNGNYLPASTAGGTVVPNLAAAPASPTQGQFWYNTGNSSLQYYNGTAVQTLGTGGGSSFSSDVTMSGSGTGLAVSNNASVGGTLAVTGATTLSGPLTLGSQNILGVTNITGAGAMTVAAGGTNQNLTLSGSGTGSVVLTGNVGIGTAVPAGTFDVEGGVASAASAGASIYLTAQSAGSSSNGNGGNIVLSPGIYNGTGSYGYVVSKGPIEIDATSTNVYGATKAYLYQLNSTSAYSEMVTYDTSNALNRWSVGSTSVNNTVPNSFYINQYFNSSGTAVNAYRFVVNNAGNVGIGTSAPSATLDTFGTSVSGAAPLTLTTTSASATSGATTISVSSTTGYPSSGLLLVGGEVMSYVGTTSTTFTGLTRGLYGTTASSVSNGTQVTNYLTLSRQTASVAPAMVVTGTGNVGIGTAIPAATLDVAGHIGNSQAPGTLAVSSCGTSPTIVGNDTRGKVTVGSGTTSSCVVTFGTAFNTAPYCVVSWLGSGTGLNTGVGVSSTTTTNMNVAFGTSTTAVTFIYHCMQ